MKENADKKLFNFGFLAGVKVSEFKFALEQEFNCVELSTNPGSIDNFLKNVPTLKHWRKYFPIPISAIGYFAVEYHRDSRQLGKLLQVMDTCNGLGVGIIHVGSGSHTHNPDEDMERTIKFLGRAIDEAKKRKLTLALYTCQVSNFAWEPKFWPKLFNALPKLRLKYDPSHAFHSNRNYIAEIEKWGEKIVHFHAKGGYLTLDVKRNTMGDPPPGKDQIDWKCLIKTLIDIKYKGSIVIEIHSDQYTYKEYYDVLKKSRDYLRDINLSLLN